MSINMRWFYLIALFLSTNVYPLIYKVILWEHPETGKRVYLMYDAHIDLVGCERSKAQVAAFVDVVNNCQARVIYEGMADYDGNEPELIAISKALRENAGKFALIPLKFLDHDIDETFDGTTITNLEWLQGVQSPFLFEIAPALTKIGTPCANVEFRHHLNASLNLNASLTGLVKFGRFFDCVQQTIQKIEAFNDEPAYNRFYQERVAHFKQANKDVLENKEWRVTLDSNQPLYQGVLGGTLGRGIMFGLELLEACAAHELYTSKPNETVFIILGGLHAQQLADVMPTLGYKQAKSVGGTFWTDKIRGIAFRPLDLAVTFAQIQQ